MGNYGEMFAVFIGVVVLIAVVVTSLAWWLLPKLWAWLVPIIHAATA